MIGELLDEVLFKSEIDSGVVEAENNALKALLKREKSKVYLIKYFNINI